MINGNWCILYNVVYLISLPVLIYFSNKLPVMCHDASDKAVGIY